MATTTQNRYEKPGSRRRWFSGIDTLNETRTYYVLGVRPDQVFIDSHPPLPPYGSQLPTESDTRNPSDQMGLTVRQFENLTLRQFIFDHEGGPTGADSAITLVYSTAPWIIEPTIGAGEGTAPRRVVHWTRTSAMESEQVFEGFLWPGFRELAPLSTPTTRVRPVLSMTATLQGAYVTPEMIDYQGFVNEKVFKGYGVGDVLFMGPDSELEGGFDTSEPTSISNVRLKFSAKKQWLTNSEGGRGLRIEGWNHVETSRKTDGTVQGRKIFGLHFTADFAELFPAGWIWDIGDFAGRPDPRGDGPRDDDGDDGDGG